MTAESRRTLLAVTAGYFLVMFAVSPVSVILPSLALTLGVSVDAASWVMTAFLLPLTACLLPAGRLGDMVGHRRVFVAGLGLVTLAGAGAGLASGLWPLLAARAAQGVGAALVSATSLPIITAAAGPSQRGRFIGLATMASSLGAMAGVALAPFVLQHLSWRWAFLAGALAGLVALLLARRMGVALAPGEARLPATRRPFDWPGSVLLMLTLVVASLSLNHFHDGPETFSGGWHWHLPLHGATALLLAMFLLVETRVPAPLIRLDQLRNGTFSTAVGANGILHMTMMLATFSLPFVLLHGLGVGPAQIGVLLVTMQATTTAMTLGAGWLYDRTRWPWLCPLALAMVASGLTWLGLAAADLTYPLTFAAVLWLGAGSGAFMTTNNTRIMGALAPQHLGFASGMLETTRQYGHTLGVALAVFGLSGALASGLSAGGAPEAVDPAAVRAGFARASLLMGAIAWGGVTLAAFPILGRAWSAVGPGRPAGAPPAGWRSTRPGGPWRPQSVPPQRA